MITPDPAGNGSKRPRGSEPASEPGRQPASEPGRQPGTDAGPQPGRPDRPDDEPTWHPSGVPAADAAPNPEPEPGAADPLPLASPDGELPAGVPGLPGEPPAGVADRDREGPAGAAHLGAESSGGTAAGTSGAGAPDYPPIPAMPVEPPPTLADRTSGSSPDETPTAPQPSVATGPRPPDWSTPDTPTIAPPLPGPAEPDPTAVEPGAGGMSSSGPPLPGPLLPGSPAPGPPRAPPPGPPGRPPYGSAGRPAAPRRRILWLILGLAAALILCCWATLIGGLVAWGDDLYGEISDRTRNSVGLNEAARDGQLEFRVTGVECGVPRVGDQAVNQVATGQFCLVQLTVRNAGDRPTTFDDSLQRAYGSGDRRFASDQTAGMIANAAQPLFLAPINPGNQVQVMLVYDIPTDARLLRLWLRTTADSRGVLVKL